MQEQNLQYPTSVHPDLQNNGLANEDRDFLYGDDSKADDQVNFIRKVLGIVAAQLSLTFTMCLASAYHQGFGNFMNRPDVGIYCLILFIVTVAMLFCSKDYRHTVPWNYTLLTLATIAEAASVAALTAHYEVGAVLTAIFVLAITLVCLCASSFFVRRSPDLQQALASSAIFSSLIILFVTPFILMSTYGKNYEWAWVVLAVVGCICSCIYVIFDLLMIMDMSLIA